MTGPLDGYAVVEVANYVSGPFAGMMLADLGAEVIKVEPPGGDPFRKFGRPTTVVSPIWASVNRGKRSIVMDLKADVAPLLELVRDADVFLSNWRPDVAERLGVGDDVLAGVNPKLVRCWISGVGPTGPQALDPAFDTVSQALSAMSDAVSSTDEPLLTAGYPVDKITAMAATQAIVAALLARTRSGMGDRLDVAMLDTTAYFDFPDLLCNRAFLDHQPPEARSSSVNAQRPIPASDGWFVVAAVSGRQLKNACHAVGRPEWTDALFAQADPAGVIGTMIRLFSPVTATKPLAYWLEQFRIHDVPAAPCVTIDEHLADPQVAHNRIYEVQEWPRLGRVRTTRYPVVSSTHGELRAGPAPVDLDEP